MANDRSSIEWTDATWSPVTGCTKVSEGCRHCYAETMAKRFWGDRHFGDVQCHPDRLEQPLRWRKPRRVFVNSMSDLFHPAVPDDFIDRVFAVMALCPQHTFQVLTKRPERMRAWFDGGEHLRMTRCFRNFQHYTKPVGPWPLPNVWLGVSVEDQATADERIPVLLDTPSALCFVSAEPLLGEIDLGMWLLGGGGRCREQRLPS
jgi:protein gp37